MAGKLTGEKLEKELLRLEEMLTYEREYGWAAHICGIDEAGRGPLAGPVVAGTDDGELVSGGRSSAAAELWPRARKREGKERGSARRLTAEL